MKIHYLKIILLNLAFAWITSAYAANEFTHPTIISRSPPAPGLCKLMNVHSYIEEQGNIYTQSGVGWFVQSDQGYHVITPAHVIAGANLVFGECQGRLFAMGLQSKSETLDIALLTIPLAYSQIAFPMIVLKNRNDFLNEFTNPMTREMINDLNPDHFNESFEKKMLRQVGNSYLVPDQNTGKAWKEFETRDIDLIGFAHFRDELPSLVVESLAIRPGYSGAPFFIKVTREIQRPQYYLAGMLTRAEINSSRSLGVSLTQILEVLPEMLSAKTTEIDVYAESLNLPVRLNYQNRVKNGVMVRSQELVYQSSTGKTKTFSEVCDDSYAESSEWGKTNAPQNFNTEPSKWGNNIAPKKFNIDSLKDLKSQKLEINPPNVNHRTLKQFLDMNRNLKSIESDSKGGDYGEGGGNYRSLNSTLFATNDKNTIFGASLTSYKNEKTCSKMAILDELGNSLDSIVSDNRIVKTTNIMEGFNSLKKKNILFTEKIESGNICDSYQLISSERQEVFYNFEGDEYVYGRTEGVARNDVKYYSTNNGYLRCHNNKIEIKLTSPILDMNVLLENPNTGYGYVNLKNASESCQVKLSTKNYSIASRWKHQIRSQQMDLDINLGTAGRILNVKVLRASSECSSRKSKKLWLEELNFSDQSTVDKTIKPATFTGFKLRSTNEK